jgi:hypothetical protein
MADELVTVFRKSANRRIEAVDVSRDEAEHAVSRWPFAWSLTPDPKWFARWPWPPGVFAEPPEGFVPAESNGGGRGRVQGASVRAD